MNKFLIRSSLCLLRRHMCTPAPGASQPASRASAGPKYKPSDFQKFILVWTKKYKSKAEIPQFVSPDLVERSRSEARIKISNILIFLTCLASLGAVLSGRAAAKRGESVHQMNLDWHKQYEEDYKKKHGTNES
ncbi:jg7433 [Pararge aegeria aegeria]|uniref:Jg7433 protein n=2 Tax=Pararge aegeria TaxID=116150 RepID=A0A8S4S367_9NEOP|nr:jg7433 [Pararge aegeria aegeria]